MFWSHLVQKRVFECKSLNLSLGSLDFNITDYMTLMKADRC